jgi:hypothetical protein
VPATSAGAATADVSGHGALAPIAAEAKAAQPIDGTLAVVVAASAFYFFYQETHRPSLQIKVDEQGITVNQEEWL